MIISQTPYRVSFAGGGTDIPSYYRQDFGAVLSCTIARHIYVTVHERFLSNLRVAYSRTEIVNRIEDLKHELVREAIKKVGVDSWLEITTIGDVPAGTGMGSSSSLTVGILNALYAFRGQTVEPEQLAAEASHIEIEVVGKPIGKQDQYAAAIGGVNYLRFNADDSVDIEPVDLPSATRDALQERMLLVYIGKRNNAKYVLQEQAAANRKSTNVLHTLREQADLMRQRLQQADLDGFGELLHDGWQLKRSIGSAFNDARIEGVYERARQAGAQGGKLLGAGGGGFMLLMAPSERHRSIREQLDHPQEIEFRIDHRGTRIILTGDETAEPITAN